ncbi:DAGKc domain-containing protein [Meloidogyne graminicola]|uniref:DAGKc domain-containing protein n=1 Tax=Meloidogyne graminicola TaxID=189291 RepID=A0A8T0A619_9BILA|nr:DAGKc domain-containing protein [Meloidogyne graminicola]
MSTKFKNFTDFILRHKKKSIFALAVTIAGGNALNSKIKDDELRRFYGEKAKHFGSIPIHPNQKLRKVIVLINNEAKRRNAAKLFNKNSLPLLNLAGIDVNIINVSTQSELENIARAIDYKEADCIFLVGGDGTVCHALNGIFQKQNLNEQLPIGLFPGGNRNKSFSMLGFLKKSVDPQSNTRLCCESTMALIGGRQEQFYPICCRIENISDKENKEKTENVSSISLPSVNYLLSEIALGWFEHCELKAPTFWWMGPLNIYFTYFWEFFKISPKAPIRVEIVYEEFCSGCRKCVKLPTNNGSFLSWLFGTNVKQGNPKLLKLVERENLSCGELHSIAVSGTDVRLNFEQSEISSKLKLKIVVTLGMLGTLREAWRKSRAINNLEKPLIVDNFDTNIEAKKIILHFTDIPEKLRKLTISGESFDFSDYLEKEIIIESMRQPLQFFVPN